MQHVRGMLEMRIHTPKWEFLGTALQYVEKYQRDPQTALPCKQILQCSIVVQFLRDSDRRTLVENRRF